MNAGCDLITPLEKESSWVLECAQVHSLCLPVCLWVGERPPPLVLSLTLNWRRRLAISYSLCSSMPRRRHHLREFLLRSDFTWVEVDMRCQGLASSERGGGTDLPPRTPSMGPNTSH